MSVPLFIIEAPAKIPSLSKILQCLGKDFDIGCTSGHLKGFRKALDPVDINCNMIPTHLEVLKPKVYQSLSDQIKCHSHIIIATDPDDEGHYIAGDVMDLCVKHKVDTVHRAFMYGLDVHHVSDSLSSLRPFHAELGHQASRRRSIDRVICSSMSDLKNHKYVGRVMTPTIYHAATNESKVMQIHRGRAFTGIEWIYHSAAMTGKSLAETAKTIQKIYEKGRSSYHRSDSHHITAAAIDNIGKAYHMMSQCHDILDGKAHSAPYPIHQSEYQTMDLMIPLECLNDEDASMTVLARQWTGSPHEQGNYSGQSFRMVESMNELGLGRPSTIPFTAERLSTSGLIDSDMELTGKGRAWVKQGDSLIPSEIHSKINEWIENGGDPSEILAELNISMSDNLIDELSVNHQSEMNFQF